MRVPSFAAREKKDRLDRLRLQLQRRRKYSFLTYLREGASGLFNLKEVSAQLNLKKEIIDLEGQRYAQRDTYRTGDFEAVCQKYLYENWLNEGEFRKMFSMDRTNFWKLHSLIRYHQVFKRGKRGPPQPPSEFQLLVLLAYLRTEGSGMCNETARNLFYIGSGSIENMKERVSTAIYETLMADSVFWPCEKEREQISKAFEDEFKIPNVAVILDGTLFGMAFTPQREDAADFNGRKGGYTLTCLIGNDHKKRIRYYHLGWPGSTHDDRVLGNSWLSKNADEAFGSKGIALGDCAYAPRWWLVPAFKKPFGAPMESTRCGFNTLLSRPRVTSEHTIGILKGRFPFLRSIRIRLTEERESMEKIQKFVGVAIILHNLLIGWNDDEWLHEDADDASVASNQSEENELNKPIPDGSTNDTRRSQLFSYYLEYLA